ncbi:hypothetical protein, partial [Lactiplantibacillus plantarum]|uniref:hypothetical protein n=1 Tax=Lactiplantibacillus plantarum TaxID=1590 RepID=UPI001EE8CEDE
WKPRGLLVDSVKEAEAKVKTWVSASLAFNCGNAHKEPKKITDSHLLMAASNLFLVLVQKV